MSALQQTVLIDHPSMQFKLADMPLLVALIKSSVFTVQVWKAPQRLARSLFILFLTKLRSNMSISSKTCSIWGSN